MNDTNGRKTRIWAYATPEALASYERAAAKMVYPPSLQDVINRGVVLAVKELEAINTDPVQP